MSDTLSVLKEAYLEIEVLHSRLKAVEDRASEPVAVIGMSCRFPGGANNCEAFWKRLVDGDDAVVRIPAERWTVSAEAAPGTRWAGLLDTKTVQEFDAEFFHISPREATSLDPQSRLLLEVAWEALETAGQVPDRLVGSKTGVFIGLMNLDYAFLVQRLPARDLDAYHTIGNAYNFAAGRMSYVLGLQGPALTVDTACSSSLVSVHLAVNSLRSRECDLALAGGANLILAPQSMEMMARTQSLSPDGRCRTFDSRANGYVRAEGCGIVVLKRLSQALRDGDPVMAIVRGTAVNQDGRSTGMTAPNVLSQQALLEAALRAAKVSPEQIGYVELHGTGTPLGDPIEAEALTAVLGKPRPDGTRCYLSSIKTCVGHMEGAAGVGGFIKTVLALQHEALPPHLQLRSVNPRIRLENTCFQIPLETTPWQRGRATRFAGVSSFGMSGTNAHVILEEAPASESNAAASLSRPLLLPVSARSPAGVCQAAGEWAKIWRNPAVSAGDLLYTASVRRSHHACRLALVAETASAMSDILEEFARAPAARFGLPGTEDLDVRPKVVFVFPGHGSQWVGMGRELLAREPVFKATVEECEAAVHSVTGWSVQAELQADPSTSRLDQVDVIQPILFALEVALAALWRSWGIEPDAVIGHSMGEIAAAHVAGVLSLPDAASVICHRSRLLRRVRGQGAMAVVDLSLDETLKRLTGLEDRLCVAVSNAPRLTVISGDPPTLDELTARLQGDGVVCRRVNTDVAFHSPQMDPLQQELVAAVAHVRPQTARIPLVSTVTASFIDGGGCDAAYWGRNLRERVRFADGVLGLVASGHNLFVELSPHPILLPALQAMTTPGTGVAVSSLRRDRSEQVAMLESVGALFTAGYALDWTHLYPRGRVVAAPTYPWQRERYWIDVPDGSSDTFRRTARSGGHPLLGHPIRVAGQDGWRIWDHELDLKSLSFLREHRLGDDVVFPAAGYLEMAFAGARELVGEGAIRLEEVLFHAPLILAETCPTQVQVLCTGPAAGPTRFQISTLHADGSGTLHVTGTLGRETSAGPETMPLPTLKSGAEVLGETLYARLDEVGLQLGPTFRSVIRMWREPGQAIGEAHPPPSLIQPEPYQWHPAVLDAAFHMLEAALPSEPDRGPLVPASIRTVRCCERPSDVVWSLARARMLNDDGIEGDIHLLDSTGRVQVEILGLRCQSLARPQRRPKQEPRPPASPSDMPGYLRDVVARVSGWDPSSIKLNVPLTSLGLDSLMLSQMAMSLSKELGLAVELTTQFQQTTLQRLATYVEERVRVPLPTIAGPGRDTPSTLDAALPSVASLPTGSPWLRQVRAQPGARMRLFCLTHAGGSAAGFDPWADRLPSDLEMFAIELPGRAARTGEQPFTRMAPLVGRLSRALVPFLDRPFMFFGHSLGALIAFELTLLLKQRTSIGPHHLFLSASAPQRTPVDRPMFRRPDAEFIPMVMALGPKTAVHAPWATVRADFELAALYQMPLNTSVDCPISVLGGADDPLVRPELLQPWAEVTTSICTVRLFPGGHFYLDENTEALVSLVLDKMPGL